VLRAELTAALERQRRLELRVAELERRLGQDSSNSGTPRCCCPDTGTCPPNGQRA